MACTDISADWAAQRIKGLSLSSAIVIAMGGPRSGATRSGIKTLATAFRYPRLGPGMMWEACVAAVRDRGGVTQLERRVVSLSYDGYTRLWSVAHDNPLGDRQIDGARHLISSAPLRQLASFLTPPLSSQTLRAADSLKYRDFLTVALTRQKNRATVHGQR